MTLSTARMLNKYECAVPTQLTPGDVALMPDLAEYMTSAEAAKTLSLHVNSIPRMIVAETLQGVKFGRNWLVSRKSVADYLDKTKGMSKNDPRRKKIMLDE